MKRRAFLQLVGASAMGLPFMCGQWGSGVADTSAAAEPSWTPRRLPLKPDEAALIAALRLHAEGVYLLGGGVLAKDCGRDVPYLNLLVDSARFREIKTALFEYGVTPVSTPDLPSHFIRFVHQGRAYSTLNMPLASFLKQNVMGLRLQLLPLAHNFLVFDAAKESVMDPYGALPKPGEGREAGRIKLIRQPASAVAGLELCFAVAFDTALLGLRPPARFSGLESAVLTSTAATKEDSLLVFHQMVSYLPDLLEVKGWSCARRYLLSPLCLSAAEREPGIDLRQVDASLRAVAQRGGEVTSAHLFAAINREFEPRSQVAGAGLPDFLASRRIPVRRKDLLAKVLTERDPLGQV